MRVPQSFGRFCPPGPSCGAGCAVARNLSSELSAENGAEINGAAIFEAVLPGGTLGEITEALGNWVTE
jgi:hypothetical protein